MTAASSFDPPAQGATEANAASASAAADGYARPAPAGPTDNSGRRIAVEPPDWDLMPPVETETVRRFRPA